MIGDAHSGQLVIGQTKAQLKQKFAYLRSPADASPYLNICYQGSPWKERDVLLIRNSPWMVIFEGEKATEFALIKGC